MNCVYPPFFWRATHGQVTLNELVKQINNLFNKNIEPIYEKSKPGDIKHSFASIDLIKKSLNFIDGLGRTIQSY